MKMLARRVAVVGGLLALVGTSIPLVAQAQESVIPGQPSVATATNPNKINVMGIWAHPDDDAGFITPCGVWHDKYGTQCGIIMLTRGEGGSNSVGSEAGPDLGLRRENEDRISHYRSGTVDIYNMDAVDFFYNTSAPLTEQLWGSERIQRQVVHVIRQTQPDILTGFSPSLAVGHGNHQYAGRVVWEAAAMAADPLKFPEQLTGPDAVSTWQVKQILGGTTAGSGGANAPQCNTGFTPASTNPYTVVGTWTGYDSPYKWLPGNVQGKPAGSAMSWAQIGYEGIFGYPTQARAKLIGDPPFWLPMYFPLCQRYSVDFSTVPFQPNGSAANGQDNAFLLGSVIPDAGGFPLGSTYQVTPANYFQAAGESFQVKITARSGSGSIPGGQVTLGLPSGWTVSGNNNFGPISASGTSTVTLTVTPAANAAAGDYKISANFSNGTVTAYNDTRVSIVSAVEGRFQRWGNFAEYETWASKFTWVGGRSNAVQQIGAGESKTIPVVVTNRTSVVQGGTVALTLPAGLSADSASKTFSGLAAGASTTVNFVLTQTDPANAGGYTVSIPIVTTSSPSGTTSSENLTLYVVPTTVIPNAAVAPVVDGNGNDVGYGPALNIGRVWEGDPCSPDGVDCGAGSTLKLAWSGDALYAVAKVVDDKASAAAPPDRCFGHWLVDSVEFLLDPMSGSVDTSTTFKSGVFPFTDDASNYNGNGVNGPCWSRDADNHQGFSTGPLAATVKNAPNAPGQQVAVNVTRNSDGTYASGSYTIEVKIPLADLPAAVVTDTAPTGVQATNKVDPHYLGLNVTPYDSDVQTFIGKTRTAWSPFGSQQSEPYRWGHAYLAGYTAPAGSSTTATPAIIPDSALLSVDSPESIYQSATRGVTLSGQAASHGLTITNASIAGNTITLNLNATEAGKVHAFAYAGDPEFTPVWVTSCAGDPVGFSACSPADVTTPPWSPDMGGKLLGQVKQAVAIGASNVTITLAAAQMAKLGTDGHILISYESASGGVNAWSYPMVAGPSATASFDSTTRQLTITASAAAPATIEYKLAGGSWVTYTGPVTVPNSITSVEYRVTDGAGNVSNVSSIDTPSSGLPPASNVDVYSTPGTHFVNGRYWNTTCEPYSQTVRCRTDIWATQVTYQSGVFVPTTGWFFNNLTYLPLMTRAQWGANPLASTGEWTSAGRQWKTECDTAVTGRNGCRNYIWASYIAAHPGASGYTYTFEQGWVLNSIVRFKAV